MFNRRAVVDDPRASWLTAAIAALTLCSCAAPEPEQADGAAAERATDSTTPAAASDVQPIGDDIDVPQVSVHWETDVADAWRTQPLQASISNRDAQPVQVEVWLLALGLDQRVAERKLRAITVAGGKSEQLSIPLDQLPIQSLAAPAQTLLMARYANAEGQQLQMPSESLHVRFRDDYAAVQVVSGEPGILLQTQSDAERARALGALLDLANTAPRGRYYAEGAWRAPETSGEVVFGQVATIAADAPTPAALIAAQDGLPNVEEPDGTLIEKGARLSTVCVRWRALFADTDLGEDYLKREEWFYGTTSNNAPYATYALLDATTMTWISSGTLSSSGCTASISLTDNHNFTMVAIPDMNGGGRNVSIRETPTSPSWRWYTANFSTTTTSPTSITVHSPLDELSNAAAVAARLHQDTALGLPSGDYIIYAKANCPQTWTNPQGQVLIIDACYMPGTNKLYIGYEQVHQQPVTLWKFVIGHELGHMIADKMFGSMPNSSYGGNNDATLCNCTHIDDVNLQSHCLQSAELYGAAIDEGFGHFFASALLNQRSDPGTFIYYKEFMNTDYSQVPPPVAKSTSAVKWWFNYCLRLNQNSTEYDWLTFYWNLYASAPQLSLAEIADVHKRACGNVNCSSSSPTVTWTKLYDAAKAKWGATHNKTAHFGLAGNVFGVDH